MSDADVVDQVLGLVRSHEDWTKAGLAGAVQHVDLDDEEHRDYEQLEAPARPRTSRAGTPRHGRCRSGARSMTTGCR
ncbi:hypothetical protein AB0M48_17645 [Lentzea sp. NPDC051208]|uniref:hypothetical protein n=1 Tax=Lentzea sp. NPDC051208 TaxID=3154642 RepID=UPI00342D92D2